MKNLFKTIFIFLTFTICFHKSLGFIEIEDKLAKVKNNFLEQINFQKNCIPSENTCFKRILMRDREIRSFSIAKECGRHEVSRI